MTRSIPPRARTARSNQRQGRHHPTKMARLTSSTWRKALERPLDPRADVAPLRLAQGQRDEHARRHAAPRPRGKRDGASRAAVASSTAIQRSSSEKSSARRGSRSSLRAGEHHAARVGLRLTAEQLDAFRKAGAPRRRERRAAGGCPARWSRMHLPALRAAAPRPSGQSVSPRPWRGSRRVPVDQARHLVHSCSLDSAPRVLDRSGRSTAPRRRADSWRLRSFDNVSSARACRKSLSIGWYW